MWDLTVHDIGSGGVACLYSDYHRCAAKYIQTIKGMELLCLAVSGGALQGGYLVVTTHTWLPVEMVTYGVPMITVG